MIYGSCLIEPPISNMTFFSLKDNFAGQWSRSLSHNSWSTRLWKLTERRHTRRLRERRHQDSAWADMSWVWPFFTHLPSFWRNGRNCVKLTAMLVSVMRARRWALPHKLCGTLLFWQQTATLLILKIIFQMKKTCLRLTAYFQQDQKITSLHQMTTVPFFPPNEVPWGPPEGAGLSRSIAELSDYVTLTSHSFNCTWAVSGEHVVLCSGKPESQNC